MSSITNDLSPFMPAATHSSLAGSRESSPGIRPSSIVPTAPCDDGAHAYAHTSGHD